MNYGLYLSATGVLTNSYKQDVIANNLANSETVGFKRDLALFQERLTEAQQRGAGPRRTNPQLENLGGGTLACPTFVDKAQGELEPTGNGSDAAILGPGYFAVQDGGRTKLTRDGRFMLDRQGWLVMANSQGQKVLDPSGKPIQLNPSCGITIGKNGEVIQGTQVTAQIGLFDVADPSGLSKEGGNLFTYSESNSLQPSPATLQGGFVERANVDSATELASLMDTQRQLEANANMIRYQDQMLSRLVNDVGKIG